MTLDDIKQYLQDSFQPAPPSHLQPGDDAYKSPDQQIPEGLAKLIGQQPTPQPSMPQDLSALKQLLPRSNMAGMMDPIEQGGLGVAGGSQQQLGNLAPQQGRNIEDILAEKMVGPGVQLGYWDRVRMREAMPGILQQLASHQREMTAYQQASLEQAQQDKMWYQNFKIATDEKLSPAQKVGLFKERAKQDPIAAKFAQGINEKMFGELESLGQYMPRSMDDYMGGLKNGSMNFDTITSDMELAKDTRKLLNDSMKPVKLQQNLERLAQQNPNDTSIQEALATLKAEQQAKQAEATTKQVTAKYAQPTAQAELGNKQADLTMKQAPKEVYSGISGPEGQSVTGIFDPRTGQTREMSGTPIQRQQIMPSAMLNQRSDLLASVKQLQTVASLFHPSFTGTIDTAKNAVARMFGVNAQAERTDPKTGKPYQTSETDFRVAYDMLQKTLRKELMGTAQSVQELASNPMAFPQASDRDADTTIPAFLRTQYQTLTQRLQAQTEAMDQARRTQPLKLQDRLRQLHELSAATTPDGKNALGFGTPAEREEAIAQRLAEEVQRGWVIQ